MSTSSDNIKRVSIKKSKFVLPVMFCSTLVFIAFINMQSFKEIYKNAIEKNPNNKQKALASIEGEYANQFLGKENYINLNGAFANLIDQKELNNVVKLNNGYLTSICEKRDTLPIVESVVEFEGYLKNKNIPYIYIQAPYKMSTDNDNLPKGFESYANENADNLLKGLNSNNIDILDLREEIKKDGLNHYDLFFKTDHHWTFEGAFWANTKVMSKVNEVLDIKEYDKKYIDINNYNKVTYENAYLGSRGQRVGYLFGGGDDITTILPKFDTDMKFEVPTKGIKKEGTFEESIMFEKIFDKDKVYQKYIYSIYTGDNYDYAKITNKKSTNKKKIFLIKDSFSLAMAPFLALHYDEVHMYDMRKGSSEDLIKKIDEVNPDIVVNMYYPEMIRDVNFKFMK